MNIEVHAKADIIGNNGIIVSAIHNGAVISLNSAFVRSIAKLIYENLLYKIEDKEKRDKIRNYLSSSDLELRSLGEKLYNETSQEKNNDIIELAKGLRNLDDYTLYTAILSYGYN